MNVLSKISFSNPGWKLDSYSEEFLSVFSVFIEFKVFLLSIYNGNSIGSSYYYNKIH
jgi:hypothetical protein